MIYRYSILAFAMAFVLTSCAVTLDKSSIMQDDRMTRSDSLRKEIALDRFLNGTIEQETGDLWRAAVYYQIAMTLDSTSSTIPVTLAKIYLELGENEAAYLLLENNLKRDSKDEESLHLMAQISIQAGNYVKAAILNRKLAEIRPLNGSELLQQAEMLIKLRNLHGALDVFAEYLARFNPSASVYRKVGQIHVLNENYAYADTAFRKLIELEPENHREAFLVGVWSLINENLEDAEKYLRLAVMNNPTEYKYWANLLITLRLLVKQDERLESANLAISQFPDSSGLFNSKANALVQLGQLDSAEVCVQESMHLNENSVGPYLILGDICHRREDWSRGIEVYEKAIEIESDNATLLNNYAYLLSEANTELEKAMMMVTKALAIEPYNASYLDTYGWLFYRMGDNKKALRLIKQAEKRSLENNSRGSAEIYDHLGHIYQALGNKAKAEQAWRKAAEIEPDNEKYRHLSK